MTTERIRLISQDAVVAEPVLKAWSYRFRYSPPRAAEFRVIFNGNKRRPLRFAIADRGGAVVASAPAGVVPRIVVDDERDIRQVSVLALDALRIESAIAFVSVDHEEIGFLESISPRIDWDQRIQFRRIRALIDALLRDAVLARVTIGAFYRFSNGALTSVVPILSTPRFSLAPPFANEFEQAVRNWFPSQQFPPGGEITLDVTIFGRGTEGLIRLRDVTIPMVT
jgi:hypothetical protein